MAKPNKCTMCRFVIKEVQKSGEVRWYCKHRDKEDVRLVHGNLWMPTTEGSICGLFESKHP